MKRLLIIALLVVLPACDSDEFFERENPLENAWPSAADFDALAVGSYYMLTGRGGSQSMAAHRRIAGSFLGDVGVAVPGAADNSDARAIYNREGGEIGFYNNAVYNAAYAIIQNANAGIELVESTGGNPYPGDPNQGQIPRIEGELRSLRAFAYWVLAQVYAPPYSEGGRDAQTVLPFRTSPARDFESAIQSELATVGQLYDLMVSDLRRAKEILPERYDPSLGHPDSYGRGRINKFGAAGLLARVLLTMGRVDEAGTEAAFVIDQNGGDYALTEDPVEAFTKGDAARGLETIWWYNIGAEGSDGLRPGRNWKRPRRFSVYNWLDNNASQKVPSNDRVFAASDTFLRAAGWIDDNLDETPAALADKRYTQLWVRVPAGEDPIESFDLPDRPYVWANKYFRGERGDFTNVIMLRLAEMHLTRALARFRTGDAAGAAEDLNTVRSRAWDEEAAGAPYTPLTAADVTEDLIHTERMIEMAFEGDRVPYLQGLGMMIPPGDREGAAAIAADAPELFFEIPQSERDRNLAFPRPN